VATENKINLRPDLLDRMKRSGAKNNEDTDEVTKLRKKVLDRDLEEIEKMRDKDGHETTTMRR